MRKILDKIKNEGFFVILIKLIKLILLKTIRFSWTKLIISEYLLEEPVKEIEPKDPFIIREAVEDDLNKLKEIVSEKKGELFKERFKKGRVCFIALDGEKAVFFHWIAMEDEESAFSPYEGCHFILKLGRGEAYLYDGFTAPEYRQKGLHTSVKTKMLKYLKDKGFKKVFVCVTSDNTFSRKSNAKAGFKGKKIVHFITLLGFKFQIWRNFTGTL